MSVSSVSSSGSNIGQSLYQYYQALNQSASATGSAANSNAAAPAGGHRHHHGHGGGGGGGGLLGQIEQAVSSALQTDQDDGTTSDPNQVIQNAIQSVLQQNGTATTTTGSAGTNATVPSSTAGEDSGSDASSAASTTNSTPTNDQSFAKLLASFGVDSQQFRQDLRLALQNTPPGGTLAAGQAFQSFPPGSVIDAVA